MSTATVQAHTPTPAASGECESNTEPYTPALALKPNPNPISSRCVAGPCWPMSLALIATTIVVPLHLILSTCAGRSTGILVSLGGLALCNLGCFLCTACRDPGLVPRSGTQQEENWRWIPDAESFAPPGVSYAAEGGVLVRGYDHFCI